MSVVIEQTKQQQQDPRMWTWSAQDFYQLLDTGFFNGRRVELIEGGIVQMSPQKNRHAMGIGLVTAVLQGIFAGDFWVRAQYSLDLSSESVVDPDVAVVEGELRNHDPDQNPTTALLIVEVSESTLHFDRNDKASLYAKAGIQDYWILNLKDRQLEVNRNPQPDESKKFGFGYADVQIIDASNEVSPLAKPSETVKVSKLLP